MKLLIPIAFLICAAAPAPRPAALPMIEDHVIVKLRPGVDAHAVAHRHGGSVRRALLVPGLYLFEIPAGTVHESVADYALDADVQYAEPDYLMELFGTPDDPRFGGQWGMTKIGAPAAWDVETGSATIRVAVLDTGCDYNHADLAGNIWTNSGEIAANGIDDDGNGVTDDVRGYDFADVDSDPMDPFGHGTNVTGILGALGNNALGVAGVCWDVEIMVVKVVTSGYAVPVSAATEGVAYATLMGARLTQNSWGVGAFSQSLYDVIAEANTAGVLFIAAAANSSADNDATPIYPSCFDLPNIISVGATTNTDDKAAFSNYGATSVDLMAPGVSIDATFPMGGYYSFTGTSQAAPHVAGACALVMAHDPALTAAQVRNRILDHVTPVAALAGLCATGGRLDIGASLASTAPTIEITDPATDVTTQATSIAFSGTASAGGSVVSVTWSGGTATGTTAWSATVALVVGVNTVEFTVTDDLGATATASRQVTRTLPPPPPGLSHPEPSSSGKCGSIGVDVMLPLGLVWLVKTARRRRARPIAPARRR